jgi:hypothetical protein
VCRLDPTFLARGQTAAINPLAIFALEIGALSALRNYAGDLVTQQFEQASKPHDVSPVPGSHQIGGANLIWINQPYALSRNVEQNRPARGNNFGGNDEYDHDRLCDKMAILRR